MTTNGKEHTPRWTAATAAAIYDTRLSHAEFRVLMALSLHSNEEGYCWPRQGPIAQRLGIGRPRVTRHIRRLVELGYVRCERTKMYPDKPDDKRTSNFYWIDGNAGINVPSGNVVINVPSRNVPSGNLKNRSVERTEPRKGSASGKASSKNRPEAVLAVRQSQDAATSADPPPLGEFGAWMISPQHDKWRQQNNIRDTTPLHVIKLAYLRWREEQQKAEAAL